MNSSNSPIDGLNAEVQAKKTLFFLKPGKHYEHFRVNLHTLSSKVVRRKWILNNVKNDEFSLVSACYSRPSLEPRVSKTLIRPDTGHA